MKPRRYRLGQRQAGVEQTRARIIEAARELLMSEGGFANFTIDAVARQAGVARMTVYYQYRSKVGVLEALCDSLAAHGQIERLAAAFGCAEPLDALTQFLAVFGGFWASDRLVIRRLRALAALDPDFEAVIRGRDQRRREGLRVIVGRLAAASGRPLTGSLDETIEILHTLSSFETFDALAGQTRSPEEVVGLVQRLARAAIGVEEGVRRSARVPEA
jgi:AcrR family transcriptional regulator